MEEYLYDPKRSKRSRRTRRTRYDPDPRRGRSRKARRRYDPAPRKKSIISEIVGLLVGYVGGKVITNEITQKYISKAYISYQGQGFDVIDVIGGLGTAYIGKKFDIIKNLGYGLTLGGINISIPQQTTETKAKYDIGLEKKEENISNEIKI